MKNTRRISNEAEEKHKLHQLHLQHLQNYLQNYLYFQLIYNLQSIYNYNSQLIYKLQSNFNQIIQLHQFIHTRKIKEKRYKEKRRNTQNKKTISMNSLVTIFENDFIQMPCLENKTNMDNFKIISTSLLIHLAKCSKSSLRAWVKLQKSRRVKKYINYSLRHSQLAHGQQQQRVKPDQDLDLQRPRCPNKAQAQHLMKGHHRASLYMISYSRKSVYCSTFISTKQSRCTGHYLFSSQETLQIWTNSNTINLVLCNSPNQDQNITTVSLGSGFNALLFHTMMFFVTLTIATAMAQNSRSTPSSPRFPPP